MSERSYTWAETAADGVIHGLGVSFALIGGPILIGLVAASGEPWPIAAVSIYVATMIAMLACSAGYNMIPFASWKEVLRRVDHSTIYLKIAGSYTPFAAISMGGAVGGGLLSVVWGAAALGVTLKLAFPRRFEWLSLALYLLMGWAAIWVTGDVAASVGGVTMTLLLIAGGLYSFGVIFHLWERLPFQNAIWHLFVLSATAVLYAAMAVEFV